MMSLFLDGVACCFKTTVLKQLSASYPVHFTDYAEDVNKHHFLYPLSNIFNILTYLMFAVKQRKTEGIFDRSVFAVLIYQIIGCEEYMDYTQIFEQIKKLNILDHNEKILILLPMEENYNLLLDYMVKRKNGLDQLTITYIRKQHEVFRNFANFFNLPTVIVDHRNPETSIEKIKNTCIFLYGSTLFSNIPISKNLRTDAGYDLRVKHTYLITAGQTQKLEFIEKIVIPENYFGMLCGRSSTNMHGSFRIGIIDATYSGTIFGIFKADNNVLFKKEERVAQLIILKCVNLPVTVTQNLPQIHRKEGGCGSSGRM